MAIANDLIASLPYAHGGPVGEGSIRNQPEDFQVDELLGYSASGEGEHYFLSIRKTGLSTPEVVDQLARFAGVGRRQVSYAGLKDKYALTTQAFSVHLPGKAELDWSQLNQAGLEVLSAQRHRRKIQIGSLRGNAFRILIRDIDVDHAAIGERIHQVSSRGVPNYFGVQRFGNQGGNLEKAKRLFEDQSFRVDRQLKSILLSSVRAYLFNLVLAERVRQDNWDKPVSGDVMLLEGSGRQFMADQVDDVLRQRALEFDIHPSGPMCGLASRALAPQSECAQIESLLDQYPSWLDGLRRFGLEADRRALRLRVSDLNYELSEKGLLLSFSLPSGSYATTVLRELVDVDHPRLSESNT